jgi:hypothetical protein
MQLLLKQSEEQDRWGVREPSKYLREMGYVEFSLAHAQAIKAVLQPST